MKTKKLLCALLAVVMAFALLPAITPQARAAASIDTLSIYIDAPVDGRTPDYSPELPSNAGCNLENYTSSIYKDGVFWNDDTDNIQFVVDSGRTFKTDHSYTVQIRLTAANGYEFADTCAVYLNGNRVEITIFNNKRSGYFEYTFAPVKTIGTVKATITAPAVGASPDYSPVLPSGARYYSADLSNAYFQNDVKWYDSSEGKSMEVSSDVFQAGHVYEVNIYLTAQSGYQFVKKPQGTVNGQTANCYKSDGQAVLSFTFPALASKPTITTQPKNCTVNEGGSASFTVVATGAESYQWYCRSSSTAEWVMCQAASAKTATHKPAALPKYSGYQYKCVITNDAGSVTSNIVTLKVNPKPTITTQPKDCTVNEGGSASFTVVAKNAKSYQWYCRTSSTAGWVKCQAASAKTATHKPAALPKYSGYQYKCVVTNDAGSVTSNIVTLTVRSKPVITTQPSNKTVNEGKKATFKVTATGAASYQWYYLKPDSTSWTKVSNNGTSATYTLTTAARHNGYKYKCAVTNAAGTVYSSVVTLTVKPLPVITTQPKSVTVTEGKTATFKVVATGATSYQWWYLKPGSSTWTKVSNNGTSATYKLTTAARHNGYKYKCVVKNAAGSVTSSVVTLTVN